MGIISFLRAIFRGWDRCRKAQRKIELHAAKMEFLKTHSKKRVKTLVLIAFIAGIVAVSGCTQNPESCNCTEKDQQITSLQQEITDTQAFNKFYTKAVTSYQYGLFDHSDAEYNYELWSWNYQNDYFEDSIDYCVSARGLYSSSNTYYQDAISYFEEANKTAEPKYQELIRYYILASNSSIDLNWAMYEACEYFESASWEYVYGDYDVYSSELDKGNAKIRLHDSIVPTYNSYVSKIGVLEESL